MVSNQGNAEDMSVPSLLESAFFLPSWSISGLMSNTVTEPFSFPSSRSWTFWNFVSILSSASIARSTRNAISPVPPATSMCLMPGKGDKFSTNLQSYHTRGEIDANVMHIQIWIFPANNDEKCIVLVFPNPVETPTHEIVHEVVRRCDIAENLSD